MFVEKCDCEKRESDRMCKYKFIKGDNNVLCGNPKKRKIINCIEEEDQLRIWRKRNAK